MAEEIDINRLRQKYLKSLSEMMRMYEGIEALHALDASGEDINQDHINYFTDLVKYYDASQDILRNSIGVFLTNLVGKEEDQSVDAVETDNGFEI
jgi:uncharacterized protein YnzC (UPF0291/DUF896 family)